jgi:hypothetical protein
MFDLFLSDVEGTYFFYFGDYGMISGNTVEKTMGTLEFRSS